MNCNMKVGCVRRAYFFIDSTTPLHHREIIVALIFASQEIFWNRLFRASHWLTLVISLCTLIQSWYTYSSLVQVIDSHLLGLPLHFVI
eukprot:CCRYP_001576-RA/>CCRYP_001576-RA protein AED:0.27 eAED:0.27 QI:355/1/1/1/0/0/2/12/87